MEREGLNLGGGGVINSYKISLTKTYWSSLHTVDLYLLSFNEKNFILGLVSSLEMNLQ